MTIAEKLIKIAKNEPKVYESGVKKGKAELAESLNPTLDEINATLDEMLALQESLKLKVSKFAIELNEIGMRYFNYVEGMTWREWIDSEYNTDGFYDNGFGTISASDGYQVRRLSYDSYVSIDEFIESYYDYYVEG